MAFTAAPPPGAPTTNRLEPLPQVNILDRLLVGGAPAVALPLIGPGHDAVAEILAVGVQIDQAGPLERLERRDRGHQLHAVVGGVGLAALELLDPIPERQDRAPAARPGIAGAGPIRMDDDVRFAHSSIP